jgi:exodeoxyribonuclease III
MAPRSVSAAKRAARLERRAAALALRQAMSPAGPASDRLRIATWNLNSLRARLPAIERFLERVQPDVLCLQETKAAQLSEAGAALFARSGYDVAFVGSGSYNGVAIAARHPLQDIRSSGDFADELLDREARIASCLVCTPAPLRVASVYVPHGRAIDHWHYDYKLSFLDALGVRLREWLLQDASVILAGDINVAATDSDVFHPDAFVGSTHVTSREREALQRLLDLGLIDVDVALWGSRSRRFTWWNHGIGYSRNLGMRLDIIATDRQLAERIDTTWIDHTEREAERPSDHAALIADFHPIQHE